MTTPTTPPAASLPALPDDVQKAVSNIFNELVEKVQANADVLAKSQAVQNANAPKAWFTDPYQLLDSVGMGYRHAPTYLTYDTLRNVSERDTVVAAVIGTRSNQVAAFARPQENKYSVGFKVRPRGRDKNRRLTTSEKERIDEIEYVLLNTGRDLTLGRDSFEVFLRKITRDSLTYDQSGFEKVKTWGGSIHSFYAVPGDTLRIAHPKVPKGTPPDRAEAKRQIQYVQLINNQIVTEYTRDELAFMVRNPRTHVKVYNYGFPEIEQLVTTVTSHMFAEEWNRRLFSQGSTVKGLLNIKGNMPLQQFEAFKRQWTAQVAGITNAWKTPVTNVDGVEWVPLQMNNTEMGYQMWMEYLIKITCAIYQIDPAEIGFDISKGGAAAQPLFMSTNEAQQKVSKDRGLHPLLRFLEDHLNKHIVWQIDPRFEFAFVGLDAKTEEQAVELRIKQVQNTHTLNEARALEDLPPLPDGDVPLNSVYTGFLMQKKQMEQSAQMMGGGAGGPPGAGGAPPPGGPSQAQQGAEGSNPNQPYAGQFQSRPPGDEEKKGANNLHGFLRRSMKANDESEEEEHEEEPLAGKDEDDESDDGPSDEEMESLHVNDWSSTIRASVKGDDLKKSKVKLFDTIDL